MLDVRDGFIEQLADVVVMQRVHDVATLTSAPHQPEMPQEAELVGDRRGVHADVLREFTDRARASAQPAEDVQAARGRECLHRVGDDPGEALVELVGRVLPASVCH